MKRVALLMALNLVGGAGWSAARAADLPLKAPMMPAYDWTGFYLGGNLGAANGTSSFSDSLRSTISSSNPASFIGGGQLGVNYQFHTGLVVGAEAMFDWLANEPTNFTASNLRAGTAAGTINNRWTTTVTGKVGFAWDRLLGYGKVGGAWVGQTNNALTVGATSAGLSGSSSGAGWTAGAGLEWAFAGNWSLRAEYDFIGLQAQNLTVSRTPATRFAADTISFTDRTIQMITLGLNYRFSVW